SACGVSRWSNSHTEPKPSSSASRAVFSRRSNGTATGRSITPTSATAGRQSRSGAGQERGHGGLERQVRMSGAPVVLGDQADGGRLLELDQCAEPVEVGDDGAAGILVLGEEVVARRHAGRIARGEDVVGEDAVGE